MNTDSNATADAPVDSTADATAPAQPKTLAEARAALKQSAADLDAAKTALTDAKAENQRIAEQFNEATAAADKASADLREMTHDRDLAVSNYNRATGQLTEANENIARLEKLMKLKGVAPSAAVPLVDETAQTAEEQRAALVKTLDAAKTPQARGIAAEALRQFDAAQKA